MKPGWQSSQDVEHSIDSARSGDGRAMGALLEHYRDYLLRVANDELASDLGVKVSPSDLVQDTCCRAAQVFQEFSGHSEPELRAWLRQILLNHLRDLNRRFRGTRKRALDRETPGDANCQEFVDEVESPSRQLMKLESHLSILAGLGRLAAEDRRAIELRSIQGLPFEEVGRMTGRSPDAARKQWARAVDRLAKELDNP